MSQIFKVDTGGGTPVVETITGNTGGAVGADGSDNIGFTASGGFSVTGNPGANSLNMAPDGWTAGSVVFASGTAAFSQDNANLFWDNSTKRLAIGNAAPTDALDVTGTIHINAAALSTFSDTSRALDLFATPGGYRIGFDSLAGTKGYIRHNIVAGAVNNNWGHLFGTSQAATPNIFLNTLFVSADGAVGVNTTLPRSFLSVAGNAAIGTYATSIVGPDNGLIVSGSVGIGSSAPATKIESEENITLTGNVTDSYASALTFDPGYTVTDGGNHTVTRLNYMDLNNPSETETSGTITITDAAVMRFDAAAGTHKAIDAGTTKTTPGTVDAWMKINLNGVIYFSPCYTSKTT